MKITYINNYNNKNTAALRKAYKAGLLELVYDRNSSMIGIKIYKAISKKTGSVKAEFHIRWTEKQIFNLDQHVWAFWDNMPFKEQQAYAKLNY